VAAKRAAARPPVEPRPFPTAAAFRRWLAKHHASERELFVQLARGHAAHLGMTNDQAVDEALCFGWIDGHRRSLDEDWFVVRFSPRKPKSVFSAKNLRRIAELEAEGRVTDAGRAALAARAEGSGSRYSFENKPRDLEPSMLATLRRNAKARAHWEGAAPSYRRTAAFWVLSAKQEATRARRLAQLVDCSARGVPIPPLVPYPGKGK
jgi:uncharacterized protein YdeI (YjbR/CyaY-like superfamily)